MRKLLIAIGIGALVFVVLGAYVYLSIFPGNVTTTLTGPASGTVSRIQECGIGKIGC